MLKLLRMQPPLTCTSNQKLHSVTALRKGPEKVMAVSHTCVNAAAPSTASNRHHSRVRSSAHGAKVTNCFSLPQLALLISRLSMARGKDHSSASSRRTYSRVKHQKGCASVMKLQTMSLNTSTTNSNSTPISSWHRHHYQTTASLSRKASITSRAPTVNRENEQSNASEAPNCRTRASIVHKENQMSLKCPRPNPLSLKAVALEL